MKVALLSILVAFAQGENCKNAVTRGVVGRSCGTDVVTVHDHRRLSFPGTSGSLKCNFKDKCESDSIFVTLGNGCFWERQYAYTHVEMNTFGRERADVTALVGYTGADTPGPNGEVCYHSNSPVDYSTLGYFETVQVRIDIKHKEKEFTALVKDFFSSFSWDATRNGMRRPDDFSQWQGDHGAPYRSGIGIPGGVKGALYKIIVNENKKLAHPMVLAEGKGSDPDVFNKVYVYDTDKFDFFVGEAYHQFHSNFFGPSYETEYLNMNAQFRKAGRIARSPGCSDYRRRSLRSGVVAEDMRSFVDATHA